MIKIRKITSILVFLTMVVVLILLATAESYAEDEGGNFSTESYNVEINVREDNSAYIRESISVKPFLGGIHGIYRYIPLRQTIDYKDRNGKPLKKVRNALEIDDISVANYRYKVFDKKTNRVIQIGDPDKLVRGSTTYNITYLAKFYDDRLSEYDSFFYNVLPNGWETSVKNAKITITMPKVFDPQDVKVMAGPGGSDEDTSKISWSVKGNTVTITTKGTLPQGSGITLGIKLPEGYFKGELTYKWTYYQLYGLCALLGILMIFTWFRYGRDKKMVQTVEFYPPVGSNAAEIGYIVDGSVNKEDIISLIFTFAQQGYIKIIEKEKNKFILQKQGDLPADAKQYEKVFFTGLFASGNSVSPDSLSDDFYGTYTTTQEMLKAEFEDRKANRIFPKKAGIARVGAFSLLTFGMIVSTLLFNKIYGNIWVSGIGGGLITALLLVACVLGMTSQDRKFALKKGVLVGYTFFSIVILAVVVILTVLFMNIFLDSLIAGIVLSFMEMCGYCAIRFMQSRTKYGAEMLGKILGFKEFIKVSELDRLRMLVVENPSYFYDVLPYAYVLGMEKKWAKKFESIDVQQPVWYSGSMNGSYIFNTWVFMGAMSSFSHNMGSISVPPGDSGSGSFGGSGDFGGFSGGGFGGGGGGSW